MCWTVASAQIDFSQLRYGVRAGFGGGMVDVKLEDDDNESQNGFQYFIGAAVELPVWKFIRLTGEIYFEHTGVSDHIKSMRMTGATAADATIFTDVTTKYPLNYIHIPIMARACFVKDFIFVETGPQIGFLVGDIKTHTEGTITTKPNSPMFPSQVQKINEDTRTERRMMHSPCTSMRPLNGIVSGTVRIVRSCGRIASPTTPLPRVAPCMSTPFS